MVLDGGYIKYDQAVLCHIFGETLEVVIGSCICDIYEDVVVLLDGGKVGWW